MIPVFALELAWLMHRSSVASLPDSMLPQETHPCANLGRPATAAQCCDAILTADAEALALCLACPWGRRIVASCPFRRGGAKEAENVSGC